jgi:hypothetical protein
VGLNGDLVVGGKTQAWAGRGYTVDYVAASATGCERLCFESKSDASGMTDEAVSKCRHLRDGALCRVIAIVGHGACLTYHDFGPPLRAAERTFGAHERAALETALGMQPPRLPDAPGLSALWSV